MNTKFIDFLKELYRPYKSHNMCIILYNCISTVSYNNFDSDIDLIEFLDKTMPEMVYIKSLIDDKEYQIYEDDLVNYTIDNFKNIIYIQLKNNKNKISIAF